MNEQKQEKTRKTRGYFDVSDHTCEPDYKTHPCLEASPRWVPRTPAPKQDATPKHPCDPCPKHDSCQPELSDRGKCPIHGKPTFTVE